MKLLSLFKILRSILNHPLNKNQKGRAIIRFIRWQIGSRLALGPVVVRFVGESQLIAEPGFSGVTGNVYTGLYEFEDMAFVLHFLRESDRFVDVGANIGAYTILASSVIGAKCIAIEPVPITFKRLCDNVNINGVYDRVRCLKLIIVGLVGMISFVITVTLLIDKGLKKAELPLAVFVVYAIAWVVQTLLFCKPSLFKRKTSTA
jgi:hypothetical protein